MRQTPQLTCLRLRFDRGVSDGALEFICSNCLELDELDLEETGITSLGLAYVANSLDKLEILKISPSMKIEDGALFNLIEGAEVLRSEYIGDLMHRLHDSLDSGSESKGATAGDEGGGGDDDDAAVTFGMETAASQSSIAKSRDIMKFVREKSVASREIDEGAFLAGQIFYGTKKDVGCCCCC